MTERKKILGIIPARGGSKRLPRKNILPLNGKPLIAYAIESALEAGLDRVIVSTDSQEIAAVAEKYGADVPFIRPAELAGDTTPDAPVFKHAVEFLKKNGERYDYILNLRPTTPFRTSEDVRRAVMTAINGNFDLVRSVTAAEGTLHPYWMYTANENGTLTPLLPDKNISKFLRSQDLPDNIFSLNGVVDLMSEKQVVESANIYLAEKMGYIEIPRGRAVDIDNETDLLFAELLIKSKHENIRTKN